MFAFLVLVTSEEELAFPSERALALWLFVQTLRSQMSTASNTKPTGCKRPHTEHGGAAEALLIFDGREASEPEMYLVDVKDAPRHIRKTLVGNARVHDKYSYDHIHDADGAESLDGLVDADHDEADQRAEDVWQYINDSCQKAYRLEFPLSVHIEYSISLAAVS